MTEPIVENSGVVFAMQPNTGDDGPDPILLTCRSCSKSIDPLDAPDHALIEHGSERITVINPHINTVQDPPLEEPIP